MKKIFKRGLALLLAVVMVIGAAPLSGLVGIDLPNFKELFSMKAEAATSGTCGENLRWNLDISNGLLSVTGTGAMTDYSYGGTAWYSSYIKAVSFEKGITSIGNYAFANCYNLTSVTIPDSVTSIGNYAFHNCENLTSITIPDSVTNIGNYAFSGTSYYNDTNNWENNVLYIGKHLIEAKDTLTDSYKIKEGTLTVADYGLYSCRFTKVTIPNSVISIGDSAFGNCSFLTNITVDDGNMHYSNDEHGTLFNKNKTKLIQHPRGSTIKDYSIPSSVLYIGDASFEYCSNLVNIEIPSNVIYIGNEAFRGCSGLGKINIPNNVTEIGRYAFCECIKLSSIVLGNSVTSIGDCAFAYCSNRIQITIPKSVKQIGGSVFSMDQSIHPSVFVSIKYLGDIEDWCLIRSEGQISPDSGRTTLYINNEPVYDLVIPEGVSQIENVFSGFSISSVTIPSSVVNISDYAFANCSKLTKATILDGATSIGDGAFLDCYSLTSITIPNSVTSIGEDAFYRCESLTSVTIPDSVTSIGNEAFYDCESLTNIIIPNGITSIGERAFFYCENLTSIIIPDSVISIGYDAFTSTAYYWNTNNWENGVLYIGKHLIVARSTTSDLYEIKNGTLTIGELAFSSHRSLKSITIPDSVICIGKKAFYNCDELTSITIPDSVKNIGDYAFETCNYITSITISDGVTSIGKGAFDSCSSLLSITIPKSITSIDECTFRSCHSLTSVIIPDSVTSICSYAFDFCDNIKDVYYAGTEEEWNNISIGISNRYLINANIHYNYIPKNPVSGDYADDTTGYSYFGKLDAYSSEDITIDGQKYNLSCYFIAPAGFYDSFDLDYVLYNLDENNEISKCWAIGGTCYTLTAYDEVAQKISVFEDCRLIDSTYDFDISDIVKESVSAQSLETLINKRVRVYEYNGFVYKVMAAETGKGVVTNFDTHHVYIDDVAYELGDREKLSENIQAALFKDAVYTLYDGVVYELMTISDVCNGLLIDTNIAEVVYNGYSFEYEIRVTNSVSSDFIGDVDGLKNIPELNINLSNIVFALSDKNWQNNNDCNEMLNYTVPDEDKLLVPGETVIVKHPVSMNYDFTRNGMAFAKYIVSAEQNSTPVSKSLCVEFNVVERPAKQNPVSTNKGNVAKAEIQSVLYSRKEDLSLTETMTWHPNIDTFLNSTQKNAIGYAILTTVVMANVSSENLNDKITDSLLSEIVGNFKEKVGIFSLNIPVTLRVDTEEHGQLIFNFVVEGFTHGGENIANYGNVTYEIIGGDGLEKVPEDKRTGNAGMLVTADIDKFSEAVYEVAEAEIEAAYDLAYGNMMNEACEILFAETVVDVMLTACNQDYKGAFFELITLPAKSATFKCPVDVFVYNENGEICASIKNGNIAVNDDNIVTEVHGGSKKITVYGLNAYQYFFEVIATGNGTMDISIEELSGHNRIMRCLDYYDLPLVAGKKYTTVLDSDFLNTETAVEINSNGMIYLPNADTLYITDISTPIEEYKVNGINVEDFSIKNGKTATITPTIASDENAEYVVLWSVADDSIAEISEKGLVTALKKGTTFISCSVVDSYGNVVVDTCSLNVLPGEFIIKWIIDESIDEHLISEGDEIIKPNNPTKEGYKFLGWTPAVPDTMPAYDLTFTAVWEEIVSNTCPYCNEPFVSETECNSHMVICPSKPVTPPSGEETNVTVVVRDPSTTTISYGDAIILHADVTGTLSAGATIKWESSNSNFAMEVSADGTTCKISPNSKGDTAFTVSVVDVNGNVISSDEQAMTSKAGFFDKIIAFFKKLFGLTKTIPQIYKGIF